jgi:hypothetical protein
MVNANPTFMLEMRCRVGDSEEKRESLDRSCHFDVVEDVVIDAVKWSSPAL